MRPVKKKDGWWITDTPEGEDFGPYATQKEAAEDLRGLERFYKYHNQKGFITCEE
jgi:hypothetical protein